jgi:hypothetical protein
MYKTLISLLLALLTHNSCLGDDSAISTRRILPEDVVPESVEMWRMGSNKFVVRWTYTESGARKFLALREAYERKAERTVIGSFESPPGLIMEFRPMPPTFTNYTQWKEGWLKHRTDKFYGVSEEDAKKIVAGLKGALGVVSVAPRVSDLGAGWTERKIIFAVDPLDQPMETVNEWVSQDSGNRSRLLTQVRAALEQVGAVGVGYFGYGFGNLVVGQGLYDFYLNRFPDQKALEKEWSNYAGQAGTQTEPGVGEAAIWLPRLASDHDHRLVVRSGSYLMRLECTAKQDKEKLVQLAKATINNAIGAGGATRPPIKPTAKPLLKVDDEH